MTPAQCVLIDDRLDFVEGARHAGMKGIVYESLPQVEKELRIGRPHAFRHRRMTRGLRPPYEEVIVGFLAIAEG